MLSELFVENIALIDRLELELSEGMNILSGETGAGKSIIIDSLNFVLGERADKTLIRYGAEFAVVQATFENYLTPTVGEYLSSIGIDCEEVLVLRRKMTVDGKNECRINGRGVTLSMLKGLTELLCDIHGQHEHQSLLKPSNHILLLDSLGGKSVEAAKQKMKDLHAKYHALKREYARFGNADERERRLDVLSYQIEEIERASVEEGEEEQLLLRRKKIRNTEKILSALSESAEALDGEPSVSAALKSAAALLSTISAYDESVDELVSRLEGAKVEIEDILDSVRGLLDSTEFDSRSAEQTEARLEVVRNITHKYGGSYEALKAFYDDAKREYDELSSADQTVERLERDIKDAASELLEGAKALSALREKQARKFEKDIQRELKDLSMGGSTFKVEIKRTEDADEISSLGMDSVEFLISPNVGEPLKPLAKIISGGEMSRFMLALKNILAGVDGIATLVFDEIDTGISGNVAAVVAQKLCNISRSRQVVAVTHMPSLAAMADSHYLIQKSLEKGKTLTHVTRLEDDSDELARLIGGNDYSPYAVMHAKEMKAWADKYKQSLKQA